MKTKELIEVLKQFDENSEVLLSSDEELNNLFSDVQVAELNGVAKKSIVIWGNSGSEVE